MLLRVTVAVRKTGVRRRLARMLARLDVLVSEADRLKALWELVARDTCDVILVSRDLLREPAGEAIRALRDLPESPEVAVLSDDEDSAQRAALLSAGCCAVLYSGLPDEALLGVLETLLSERRKLAIERLAASERETKGHLSDFVSVSPVMQSFTDMVRRVTSADTTLLISGETGVGKEWLARAIHAESPRGGGPLIAVNCAAVTESLMESELFGHEEGAFTGATRSRRGCFELAHRGTLFLDEVGEIPTHLQAKLLRVLQEREIQRVGGERMIRVDVRVIAATNRDLAADVEAGRFRQDLYFRLGVVALEVPPLRERREDIAQLVESYVGFFRASIRSEITSVSPEAMEALVAYAWPGNVRELINVIERAMLLGQGSEILPEDLPGNVRRAGQGESDTAGSAVWRAEALSGEVPGDTAVFSARLGGECLQRPLRELRSELIEGLEIAYLRELLTQTGGRVGEAAARAGVSPRALYEKMCRYGLSKEAFREGAK